MLYYRFEQQIQDLFGPSRKKLKGHGDARKLVAKRSRLEELGVLKSVDDKTIVVKPETFSDKLILKVSPKVSDMLFRKGVYIDVSRNQTVFVFGRLEGDTIVRAVALNMTNTIDWLSRN